MRSPPSCSLLVLPLLLRDFPLGSRRRVQRRLLELLELLLEVRGVLESLVDGGEPDVRHLVEPFEALEHHAADLRRLHGIVPRAELLLDAVDHGADGLAADRALLARL